MARVDVIDVDIGVRVVGRRGKAGVLSQVDLVVCKAVRPKEVNLTPVDLLAFHIRIPLADRIRVI